MSGETAADGASVPGSKHTPVIWKTSEVAATPLTVPVTPTRLAAAHVFTVPVYLLPDATVKRTRKASALVLPIQVPVTSPGIVTVLYSQVSATFCANENG